MKQWVKWTIAVVAFVAVSVVGLSLYNNRVIAPGTNSDSIAGATTVRYQGVEGKTALDLLRAQAQVESEQSSFGAFVTSINGTKNGSGPGAKYWLYYVNGKAAEVAADKYVTKSSDVVEWRYEAASQ